MHDSSNPIIRNARPQALDPAPRSIAQLAGARAAARRVERGRRSELDGAAARAPESLRGYSSVSVRAAARLRRIADRSGGPRIAAATPRHLSATRVLILSQWSQKRQRTVKLEYL